MATYKLIQDIEAEDKILGPLTLRQFIFAMIAVLLFYICFVVIVKHVVFLLALFLPPALFFGFFALPFGRDQPTEIWALAKLRFWFKPRHRVWNQSGIKEMVTITVPKKVERVLTNGLSQTEVSSRLQALAQTLDSRGWAVKHVAADIYSPQVMGGSSDRLISFDSLPQEVASGDAGSETDMLDETANPIARQFDNMMNQSSQMRRQELMSQLNAVRTATGPEADMWFMNRRQPVPPPVPSVPAGGSNNNADEGDVANGLAARVNSRQASFGNLRTVQPITAGAGLAYPDDSVPEPAAIAAGQTAGGQATMTVTDDPDILSLARNDDLNVATLAREANKKKSSANRSSDEVVIPLH